MLAGCLDIAAPAKKPRASCGSATRSTSRCVTLEDVPGFLPGLDQEHGGIIRHGAKLLYAFAEATVRSSRSSPAKSTAAPTTRDGVQLACAPTSTWPGRVRPSPYSTAAGATKILYRREIAASKDPAAMEAQKTAEYEEAFNNPYMAASRGYIDDVIEAQETRPVLIKNLEILITKQETPPARKHGNILCKEPPCSDAS
ncbi:MAG: carboxyl transferase domain-containing protein [Planctomycetota bacterium]